jgi:CrcB protein
MSTSPTFVSSSTLVFLGGGFGAWLRYLTGRAWLATVGPIVASNFPWATLTVNVAGSLAMGLLVGWLARHGPPPFALSGEHWRLLLGVGVLGGYTTFSAFALEFALFVERGNLGMAAVYVGTSLLAGFLALFAGLYVMRVVA